MCCDWDIVWFENGVMQKAYLRVVEDAAVILYLPTYVAKCPQSLSPPALAVS